MGEYIITGFFVSWSIDSVVFIKNRLKSVLCNKFSVMLHS